MADNYLIGTIPVKNFHTDKRIPPTIRGTIYEAMLRAVSEELAIWRAKIGEIKTTFYDIDSVDINRLIDLANEFGVPFITTIKGDLSWIQEEVRSIPFKIFHKGTTTLYISFITAVNRFGEIFVYTYREDFGGISRSMLLPFEVANITPQNKPFVHKSRGDFSGTIKSWISLDEAYYLDAGESLWRLDTSSSVMSTNHIGIEYWIDRIIQREIKDGNHIIFEDFLMTKEYLDYMDVSMEFGRRAKEVPHIGSQLSVQTDLTGLCNAFDPSSEYSVPDLKLKIAARSDLMDHAPSGFDIEYIEFGVGAQKIASVQNPEVPFPIDLNYRVARIPILFRDHYDTDNYIGAEGEYLGKAVQEIKLLSGSQWFDGVNKNFNFTLPLYPVQRGNIVFEFRLPESFESAIFPVEDDRKGKLISTYGKGNINYQTGVGNIITDFEYNTSEFVITQPVGETDRRHFVQELVKGSSTVAITKESVWLSFMIGEGVNRRMYLVQDDGLGHFYHQKIVNGLINYQTRILDVTFTDPLVDPEIKPFKCDYSYHIDYALPEGTEFWAHYYFTQQIISITEAGFRSRDGTLIIYATFPPLEFSSTKYHCNFLALVKKNTILPLQFYAEDNSLYVNVTEFGKNMGASEDQFEIDENGELQNNSSLDLKIKGDDVIWQES
jgi:hypothetical protein